MPTAYTGTIHSYTDTTAHVRCIEDLINNISPRDIPFTKRIGVNSIKNPVVFSTTYEWLNDELAPTSTTLGEAIASTNTTTCAVASSQGNYFRAGHLIEIDDEIIRVASVSSDTLTISRAFGGSTAATHANASNVYIMGVALVEGADAPDSFKMDVSTSYNYTQIFQETVQVTGTQAQLKQYGIRKELDYQLAKKFEELAILLELGCIRGGRSAGSSTVARGMGGLTQFITDNTTDMSTAALTEKQLMDSIQSIYDDVGGGHKADLIMCNGWVKRKINSFYAPYARMDRAERTGGVIVDQVDTDFGLIDLMMNVRCPGEQLFILSTDFIQIGPLQNRGFFKEELAKSGDYTRVQVVGEYTMKVANDKAHAFVDNISTSS